MTYPKVHHSSFLRMSTLVVGDSRGLYHNGVYHWPKPSDMRRRRRRRRRRDELSLSDEEVVGVYTRDRERYIHSTSSPPVLYIYDDVDMT